MNARIFLGHPVNQGLHLTDWPTSTVLRHQSRRSLCPPVATASNDSVSLSYTCNERCHTLAPATCLCSNASRTIYLNKHGIASLVCLNSGDSLTLHSSRTPRVWGASQQPELFWGAECTEVSMSPVSWYNISLRFRVTHIVCWTGPYRSFGLIDDVRYVRASGVHLHHSPIHFFSLP